MEETLINFETAKLAKEKGFNVECEYGYTRLKELMTIDRSQESFFGGASRNYRNSELESYNKSYLECNDDEYVCIYTAPTQSLLQKWLREEHNIHIKIDDFIDDETGIEWDYEIVIIGTDLDERGNYIPLISYDTNNSIERKFKTYEEALEMGLQKALKLIPNNL